MKAMKLRRYAWPVIAVIVLMCGTVFALMFHQTQLFENLFEPAYVDCEVHEKLDVDGDYTSGTQNAQIKTGITVKNTGNIDAYLRVRLVTYWVDDDGNVVGKPSPELNISANADWVRGSGNTFYYKYAVSPAFSTGELLSQAIELQIDTDGTRQVIEVFADAIQSLPEKAVAQSWPVTVADGQIISAS